MTSRHDVSAVEPQGSYVAKQCPVRLQNDILRPAEPLAPPEHIRVVLDEGVAFEAATFDALAASLGTSWHHLDDELDAGEAIAATVSAMERQVPVIAGGFLPIDRVGRRSGRPDLLVFAGDGYVPVDVKHHRTFGAADGASVPVSPLGDPRPAAATPLAGAALRRHKGDALQLAHYRRMLQACGHAASTAAAGIIGTEQVAAWYDLDEPLWATSTTSGGRRRTLRSSMEVYDFEFGFRLDVAAVALRYRDGSDPDVELLVEPVSCHECPACGWRDGCAAHLGAGTGDPSLLPHVGYRQWRALRHGGVSGRDGVAALHLETARLSAAGVNTAAVLEAAAAAVADTPVAELIPRAPRQQQVLADAGIETAADVLERVAAATASFGRAGWLPRAIVDARAALGPRPVYRLPGAGDGAIDRFDIEIDVDMENTADGVYLWGALVTDRAGSGLVTGGYRPFVTWEAVTPESEVRVFAGFWSWLSGVVAIAERAGLSVAGYCWYDGAENPEMRRIARRAGGGLPAEVERFIGSGCWIDLMKVFTSRWTTGGSSSLKAIAALAGHEWDVDDPGGAVSMARHAEALGAGPGALAARRWLLDYNRGDVEATLAVRDWLTDHGSGWPEVPNAALGSGRSE